MSPSRPLLHPLAGSQPAALVRTLASHGGVALDRIGQVGLLALCSTLNAPFAWVEAARTRAAAAAPLDPPPIFIVGHWRSGTTLLHNLLSRDPRFCFPRIADVLRPHSFYPSPVEIISRKILLHSMPAVRPMDGMPLREDLPQEDELALAAMGAPSFLNCLYFPRRMERIFAEEVLFEGAPPQTLTAWRSSLTYYLAKLARLAPGRRLLVKNPAHSARIDELRRLFPGAKFIHVHREPAEVLASTRKLYRIMLSLVALQPYDMARVEDHIAQAYGRLLDRLDAGLERVAPADRIELAYPDLVADSAGAVSRIYGHFGLTGFQSIWPAMQWLLEEDRPNGGSTNQADREFARRQVDRVAVHRRRLGYPA
jgi:omega-hydroxy-beta-dihydromenaquinone-9 sulfotransferase